MTSWESMTREQRVEAVRQYATYGETPRMIAARFEVSRNIVMGLAYRSGFNFGGNEKNARKKRTPPKPKPGQKPFWGPKTDATLPKPRKPDLIWTSRAYEPLPGTVPVSLLDLPRRCCKWPIGDPVLFCAVPTDGRNYCTEHHKRSRIWR